MKQIQNDILRLLADKPGISSHKVGIELSGKWNASYSRMTVSELIHQGLLISDTSGKHGHRVSITEAGKQALEAVQE